MAVMLTNLARYLGMYTNAQDTQLNDKSEMSSWASDSVNFVPQNKIMQGTGNNRFSPKTSITREQTYIIMYRMPNMKR